MTSLLNQRPKEKSDAAAFLLDLDSQHRVFHPGLKYLNRGHPEPSHLVGVEISQFESIQPLSTLPGFTGVSLPVLQNL